MKKLLTVFGLIALLMPTLGFAKATNKRLVIGITQEFASLNRMLNPMAATSYISAMVGRPLTAYNADWNLQCYLCVKIPSLTNGLAKKITDKDGKEKIIATWEIHPHAKWGDGTPVTGHDVKFSWKVGSTNNISVGQREVYAQIEAITVDKTNPKRFSMKYARATYDFNVLGSFYILPKHIEGEVFAKNKHENGLYEKNTTFTANPTNPGLYMGPYLVEEYKASSHITLKPNKYWFGKKPKIQQIIVKLIQNTQSLEANLRSGTVDMASEIGVGFDQALAIKKRAKPSDVFEAKFREGVIYEHIDLNLENPILKDINVRKALVHAIDRDKLTQALFEGKQKKAIHNINPADVYYTEDVVLYDYNPAKAKMLLAKAGWKAGSDGILLKDGKKLALTLMSTAQDKTRELVEVFLQAQWKKVGVDIQIKNEPARVFFGETARKRKFPHMAMYAWIASPDNPPISTSISKNIPTAKNGWMGQNRPAWRNQKVDQLLEKVVSHFDLSSRQKIMRDYLYEYSNDVPVIPLYYRTVVVVAPKNLKGHRITGHQFYSSYSVEDWELVN